MDSQDTSRWVLLRHIGRLVTMSDALGEISDALGEISDALVVVRDGEIVHVGTEESALAEDSEGHSWLSRAARARHCEDVDLRRHVCIPGMVNCHHHMYQSLTRCVAQDAELFDWLTALYEVWARMTPEHIYVSALVAMSELVLSGCTTSTDHLYLFPNGCRIDDEIEAARAVGIRFHPCRGAMSVGKSRGGLPPDSVVEDEDAIVADMERVVAAYHDPSKFSMLRIALAPCSPFSVSEDLMRRVAKLARSLGVRMHTHLAESEKDIEYSRRVFGKTPGEYARSVEWVGDDVWFAHCVCLTPTEWADFASTSTGVCHCPASNLRLASGIAPVRPMLNAGVTVGIGVDGSASNDSGNMLAETRLAMLLQRAGGNPAAMSARDALRLATVGGARLLGRGNEIGRIAPGYAADIAAFRTDGIDFAGAQGDVVAGLLFCSPTRADVVLIGGRVVVRDGNITTIDIDAAVRRHNVLAAQLRSPQAQPPSLSTERETRSQYVKQSA